MNSDRDRGRGRGGTRGRTGNISGYSSPRGAGDSAHRYKPELLPDPIFLGADSSPEDSLCGEDGLSISEKKNLGQMSAGGVSMHTEHKPKLGITYQKMWHPCGSKDGFSNVRTYQQGTNSPDGVGSGSEQSKCLVTPDSAYKQDFPPLSGHSGSEGLDGGRIQIEQTLGGRTADVNTLHHDFSNKLTIPGLQSETQQPSQSAKKDEPDPSKGPKSSTGHNNLKHSGHSALVITSHNDFSDKLIISGSQSKTQLPSQSAKKNEPAPSKGPKHSGHSADVITLHHEFSYKLIIPGLQSETQLPSHSSHTRKNMNSDRDCDRDRDRNRGRGGTRGRGRCRGGTRGRAGNISGFSSPCGAGNSAHRYKPELLPDPIFLGADSSPEDSLCGEDGLSISETKNLGQMSAGGVSMHTEHKPKLGITYQKIWHPCGSKDGFSNVRTYQQGTNSPDGVGSGSEQSKCLVTPNSAYKQDFPPLSGHSGSEGLDGKRIQTEQTIGGRTADVNTLHHDFSNKLTIPCSQSKTQLPSQSAKKDEPDPSKGPKSSTGHNNSKHSGHSADVITFHDDFSDKLITSGLQSETQLPAHSAKMDEPAPSKGPKSSTVHNNSTYSEHPVLDPFDICPPKTVTSFTLKPSLHTMNRQKRNEIKRSVEGENGIVLRSGMIHLKDYISLREQATIVKSCRDLGLGPGGFYQPGYRDGGKLQLKMMCLGKNWDPEARKYGKDRPFDGAKPPVIPDQLNQLVKKAITDSHSIIQKKSKASNVENILPWMSPDICIVNFYTVTGRLGLHKDCDESEASLVKGLPVVSFSIGDSADFLYGDQRDEDKAEKVKLESGDVLIFGGESRHVFHGVTAIHPNTAPKTLLEETNLRPGRLNLTFREY